MEFESIIILAALIFIAAILYSSVGHAGASGYLAVMALFVMSPSEMKPTALTLNILVASIAVTKYLKADCFSWSIFWPFALSSIPFAYLGGLILLPSIYYKPIVGVILIYAAIRFAKDAAKPDYIIKTPINAYCFDIRSWDWISFRIAGHWRRYFVKPVAYCL